MAGTVFATGCASTTPDPGPAAVREKPPSPAAPAIERARPEGMPHAISDGLASPPPSIVVTPPGPDDPKAGDYVYVEEFPEAIRRVPPAYPDAARQAKVEGTVALQVLVGRDGLVRDVKVVKSVPGLDQAAIEAVRQWKFKPALTKGEPVAVWVMVPVVFTLN